VAARRVAAAVVHRLPAPELPCRQRQRSAAAFAWLAAATTCLPLHNQQHFRKAAARQAKRTIQLFSPGIVVVAVGRERAEPRPKKRLSCAAAR